MYIVLIAWLYVTVLMAATEPSITAGVLTFTSFGLIPCALFLWLFGTPQRRRNQAKQQAAELLANKELSEPNRTNSEQD
ncbi:MAG TPA: hypothetical protein VGJ90_06845 [Methylophilaceae bacterium]|jgi:hypothetical protein